MLNKFAINLKVLRKKTRITQEKLGSNVGLTQKNIQTYESGVACPNYDNLIRIADYFSVTIDQLLREKIELHGCELCGKQVTKITECDHPKNGYCAVFRHNAAVAKLKSTETKNRV